jgi:hypothetical protein
MRGRWRNAVSTPQRAAAHVAACLLVLTTLARGQAPDTLPATPLPEQPAAEEPPSAARTAPDTATAANELAGDPESAALLAELSAATSVVDSDQRSLDVYGFADFTFVTQIGKRTIGPPQPTFTVGNVNVYLAGRISERLRSLIEVRFLYLPHGTVPTTQPNGPRIDTASADPADVNRPLRWGGVELERVWVEYQTSQELTLRVGQWLSPYGIWNVDHGSPTFIPTIRPYVIGDGLIPERQTGVEAYGSMFIDATQLGYHLTLSNGRGPIDAYQDLDANKAIGGRVFVSNDSLLGTLSLGVSGYRGTYTDRPEPRIVFDPEEGLIANDSVSVRYREQALAADLKWQWQGWLLQSEIVMSDVVYDNAARPPDQGFTGGPPGFAADQRRIGGYGLLGYRTPWWGIMPYALLSMFDNGVIRDIWAYIGGFNVRSTPNLVLKLEYTKVVFLQDDLPGYQQFLSQVAWSF